MTIYIITTFQSKKRYICKTKKNIIIKYNQLLFITKSIFLIKNQQTRQYNKALINR